MTHWKTSLPPIPFRSLSLHRFQNIALLFSLIFHSEYQYLPGRTRRSWGAHPFLLPFPTRMLLLSVLEKFVVNVWVFTSPRVSPVFFKQPGGPNQRPHWAVRSFLAVNILRALSHTVAVYDPELHPKKKFAVVRPAHSYMQIDEYICKQFFRDHFSSRSSRSHARRLRRTVG